MQGAKLSRFLGMERLGAYPPPEFDVVFAARAAQEDKLRREAKARKAAARAARAAEWERRALARQAKSDLLQDPFNPELIEATGDAPRANKYRRRAAK
jgi:hypothetical protein